MNFDAAGLSIIIFIAAAIAFCFLVTGFCIGVRYGRQQERNVSLLNIINAQRRIEELADDDDFHARVRAIMARQDREMGPKWPEDIDVSND